LTDRKAKTEADRVGAKWVLRSAQDDRVAVVKQIPVRGSFAVLRMTKLWLGKRR